MSNLVGQTWLHYLVLFFFLLLLDVHPLRVLFSLNLIVLPKIDILI